MVPASFVWFNDGGCCGGGDGGGGQVREHGTQDLVRCVGYAAFYLGYMLFLKKITGEFVYPIFEPITAKFGFPGLVGFGVVLSAFVTLLGYVGVCLV